MGKLVALQNENLPKMCVFLNICQHRCCCHMPEQTRKSEGPLCHLPALWLKKLSATLLQHSQSFTITEVYQPRPCLHPTASSSSSHRTGCIVSKLRFHFTIWFESLGGEEAVTVIKCGLFSTQVYSQMSTSRLKDPSPTLRPWKGYKMTSSIDRWVKTLS